METKLKPKAFLFARIEDNDTNASANEQQSRITLLYMCCGNDYKITHSLFFLTKTLTFEENILPLLIKERENNCVEPLSLIVCFWDELALTGRKAFIKRELEKLNIKIKVLYY